MEKRSTDIAASPDPISPLRTALYFLLGNVLPSFGLFVTLRGSPMPASWQSGEFHDYVTFLLSSRAAALFYPFFFYAIACFTLGLFRPEVASRRFWVRFGIYSGIPLALQYCLVVGIVLLEVDQVLSWRGFFITALAIPLGGLALVGIPWIGWLLLDVLKRYLKRTGGAARWVAFLMFAAPALALLCGLIPGGSEAEEWVFIAVFLPGLVAIVATPVWMAAVYAGLARRIHRLERRRFQLRLVELLGVFSWLAAYMAAWRFAVLETLEAYAALPTSPPSACYIATAAAQGDPWLVRSWSVRCSDGAHHRVNRQVAYLKCGEFVLRSVSPRLHLCARSVYDQIGPILARRIRHPLAADIAYLSLKPGEWIVRLVIACVIPEAAMIARRLYP